MSTQSELFRSNLDLVPKICSRWRYESPTLDRDDMNSIARFELWESAGKYDGIRSFRSYAAIRIANALRDSMRDDGRANRNQKGYMQFELLCELETCELDGGDSKISIDSYIDARTDPAPLAEDALSDHDEMQVVRTAVDALPPAQADVIRSRYFGDELEKLSAIGAERGVSRERIRQIESDALGKLRKRLVR